jgi:hypothetical protein
MSHDKWIPVLFLASFLIRIVALGTSGVADAFVILFLSLLYGWRLWIDHNTKVDPSAELIVKVDELNTEINQMKNSINVVKLTTGIKNERPAFKF